MTNLTAKQQYWSEQLKLAESQGQSLVAFAKSNNIPAQKLYQWRSSLKKKTTIRTVHEQVSFAELVPQPVESVAIKLQHKGSSIQISALPDADWLARFLRQLCAS